MGGERVSAEARTTVRAQREHGQTKLGHVEERNATNQERLSGQESNSRSKGTGAGIAK